MLAHKRFLQHPFLPIVPNHSTEQVSIAVTLLTRFQIIVWLNIVWVISYPDQGFP
jgi:hypothetical protein